jgi:DNA-binding transcriptional LysR family regulator
MTFTQLEIFALVAELRGFTAAALRLGVSQSAVSHAIKSLEQELGVQLIERQGATADVTELGKRLLVRVREILGLTESMRQEVALASGLNKGLLRIGSFGPTSSLKLIPAILDVFQKRYPGIEVRIDEGTDNETLQWILDRRVDIGFVQQTRWNWWKTRWWRCCRSATSWRRRSPSARRTWRMNPSSCRMPAVRP